MDIRRREHECCARATRDSDDGMSTSLDGDKDGTMLALRWRWTRSRRRRDRWRHVGRIQDNRLAHASALWELTEELGRSRMGPGGER